MPRTQQIKKSPRCPRKQLVSQRIARKDAPVTVGPFRQDYEKRLEMFYPIAMSKNEISHPPKDMPAARVEFYKRLHEKRDNMETQELVREYKLKAQQEAQSQFRMAGVQGRIPIIQIMRLARLIMDAHSMVFNAVDQGFGTSLFAQDYKFHRL